MKELRRLYNAWGYSCAGLRAAWRDAGAFCTELALTPFIAAAALYFGADGTARALLLGSWLLVLVVELLNTGIEAAVDLAARGEIHPHAKKAKDTASAAVLCAAALCVIVWLCVLS